MKIDKKDLTELKKHFERLYKEFKKKTTGDPVSVLANNAVLYTVIIELVNNKTDGETSENQMIVREEILNTLLEKWKELDPGLEINEELIAYHNQFKSIMNDKA